MKRAIFWLMLMVLFPFGVIEAATYRVLPDQSRILFLVSHLNDGGVTGNFSEFSGQITWPLVSTPSATYGLIEVSSLNTQNRVRDAHLKSFVFFHQERFPEIRYRLTTVETVAGKPVFVGDLTIKGVSKVVRFSPEINMTGDQLLLNAEFQINRHDFGLSAYRQLIQPDVTVRIYVIGQKVSLVP